MTKILRAFIGGSIVVCVLLLSSGCFSLHRAPASEPAVESPPPVSGEKIVSTIDPETAAVPIAAPPPRTAADVIVDFVLADDQQQRMVLAAELCRFQQETLAREPTTPMELAAQYWLEEYLSPRDENSRRRSEIGPRSGIEDLHHTAGYELYLEAAGGVLIFTREGHLLGRIGDEDRSITDLAFYDVDNDGQSEAFIKYDSGGNSGNRFTRIVGYKEVGGTVVEVFKRKLYETTTRWVPAGLGARLVLMELAGSPYLVVDPEGEMEVLRWDNPAAEFVRESAPKRRAFLD